MADRQLFSNNAETVLPGTITAVATSITVTDSSDFATPGAGEYQLVTLEQGTTVEIVKMTDNTTNVLTVVRAQEGTTGFAFTAGTLVEARDTAATLDAFPQSFDNGGNAKGTDSVNLQPSRTTSDQVAEGDDAIVIGSDTRAAKDYDTAIGGGAAAQKVSADYTEWQASTAYSINDMVYFSTAQGNGDNVVGRCIVAGTSDSFQPAISGGVNNGPETDGTVVWYPIDSGQFDHSGFALGRDSKALGLGTVALGRAVEAIGSKNHVIGDDVEVYGSGNFVVGGTELWGNSCTFIKTDTSASSRNVVFAHHVGDGWPGVSYTGRIVGPDYVPYDNRDFQYMEVTPLGTIRGGTKPQIFTGPPICLGLNPWQASTTYAPGAVITPTTPNGYSYYAVTKDVNYHINGTSGSGEPTWGTTVMGTTTDNGIMWVCVDPTSIIMKIPAYLRFIPDEVGFIGDMDMASATTQPYVSFGISTDLDKWLTTTQTTMLGGAYAGQKFNPTNTEGATTVAASMTTIGDGATTGRFYWKGICIEAIT